jgi:ankyrin repeat protein
VNTGIALRLLVFTSVLVFAFLRGNLGWCQESAKNPIDVTISDLSLHPQKFDGQLVRFQGLLVLSWEGDNFISDPDPQRTSSSDPSYVWFYCNPDKRRQVYGSFAGRRSIHGSFTGYFHFVPAGPKTRIVYGAFDPGPLQFEAVEISIPEPQPRSLSEAIRDGNLEETRKILRNKPNLNVRDEYKLLPLFHAIEGGHADIVDELLAAGADPKIALPGGDTVLAQAAWTSNVRIAKALLDHGASVNAANAQGETALTMAPHKGADEKMVRLLLDAGANPNAACNAGMTALISAAMSGDALAAEELLEAGADPACKDKFGNTAESESCDRGEAGHFHVCELVRQALYKK